MNRINASIPLLITGCIFPSTKQKYLFLKESSARHKQYIECIRFFLVYSPFEQIVFCDNSLSYRGKEQIEKIAMRAGKQFEWISFRGDTNLVELRGKGYGEGEIIDFALKNSMLLSKTTYFAKVTGRLQIRNIDAILKKLKRGNYFNVDIYRPFGIDTRFYVCGVDYYNCFLRDCYKSVYDINGNALEDLFFSVLMRNHSFKCLPYYPRFVGVSGGNGRDYGTEARIKLLILDILCKLGILNECLCLYKTIQQWDYWHRITHW